MKITKMVKLTTTNRPIQSTLKVLEIAYFLPYTITTVNSFSNMCLIFILSIFTIKHKDKLILLRYTEVNVLRYLGFPIHLSRPSFAFVVSLLHILF